MYATFTKMSHDIHIRPYLPTDQQEVIAILQLNTPHFFAHEEKADLLRYLAYEREDYFVLTQNQTIIGSGGINYKTEKNTAYISWDLLHPHYQRHGYGSQLLQYRISRIAHLHPTMQIVVRTSQLAYAFYEANGFILKETIPAYWAPGFDLYYMIYHNKAVCQ